MSSSVLSSIVFAEEIRLLVEASTMLVSAVAGLDAANRLKWALCSWPGRLGGSVVSSGVPSADGAGGGMAIEGAGLCVSSSFAAMGRVISSHDMPFVASMFPFLARGWWFSIRDVSDGVSLVDTEWVRELR